MHATGASRCAARLLTVYRQKRRAFATGWTGRKIYYDILKAPYGADEKELKKAYRREALKHHPDRNPGDASAEARFMLVAEAFRQLTEGPVFIDSKDTANENTSKTGANSMSPEDARRIFEEVAWFENRNETLLYSPCFAEGYRGKYSSDAPLDPPRLVIESAPSRDDNTGSGRDSVCTLL